MPRPSVEYIKDEERVEFLDLLGRLLLRYGDNPGAKEALKAAGQQVIARMSNPARAHRYSRLFAENPKPEVPNEKGQFVIHFDPEYLEEAGRELDSRDTQRFETK